MFAATAIPALNSVDRVIPRSVTVPPPLQPQIPTRPGSTQGCAFNHFTPARMSSSSPSLNARSASASSSFLLIPVALRLSKLTTR